MKREKWFPVIGCVILIMIAGLIYFHKESGKGKAEEAFQDVSSELSANDTPSGTPSASKGQGRLEQVGECAVYICGAVKHPGVYHMEATARVCDVIEAAGGLKNSADLKAINQARHIEDAEQIYIQTKQETKAQKRAQGGNSSGTAQVAQDGGKVNLNQASIEQLMTLRGIGEAKANAIIAYRTENGSFQKIEDIMKISGIKEGVYNQIKDSITVD